MNGTELGGRKMRQKLMATKVSASTIAHTHQKKVDDWANLFMRSEHRNEREVAHSQDAQRRRLS